MKVQVEFLLSHTSDVYDVGRAPCIGEYVVLDDKAYEVKSVMHMLNADPETQVLAIVRVR